MKLLILLSAMLTGCATMPPAMDAAQVGHYLAVAAQRSMRPLPATAPKVYVIADAAEFKRLTCRDRHVLCGLGEFTGGYFPAEKLIIVNGHNARYLGPVLIHELVHYLQDVQHDRRSCVDREFEAYRAQFGGSLSDIGEYVLGSCYAI